MQSEYAIEALVKEINYAFYQLREDGMHEIVVKSIKAVTLPVKDIAKAVTQEPSKELEISVLQEMKYPIIVCFNTANEHAKAIKGLLNARPFEPGKPYLNIIGNQRQTIAEMNGFDAIDAFIVETGIEALVVKKVYDEESAIK